MAFLTKDDYLRRSNNASRRMLKNKEIALENGSLTEEQCDALEELCETRHKIHSLSVEDLFNSESPDNEAFNVLDGDGIIETIRELFPIESKCIKDVDLASLPSDIDWFEELIDVSQYEDFSDYMDESLYELNDIVEKWNDQVEEFLGIIDDKYGTNYKPTGLQRIF